MCDVSIMLQSLVCIQDGVSVNCSSIQEPTTQADCIATVQANYIIENIGTAATDIDNVQITSTNFQCCDGSGVCVDIAGGPRAEQLNASTSTVLTFECMIDLCGPSSEFKLKPTINTQADDPCVPS